MPQPIHHHLDSILNIDMKEVVFVLLLPTLFITGSVISQSSIRQGWKCGIQCAESVDINGGGNFVHLSAQVGAFT